MSAAQGLIAGALAGSLVILVLFGMAALGGALRARWPR